MPKVVVVDGVISTQHPLYSAWASMIGRCEQPSAHSHRFYAAKGIKVCPRWRTSFAAFVEDMGPKPDPSYSLDRIDPAGNYEPANCRWADHVTQGQNSSTTRPVTVNGIDYPSTAEAARAHGLDPATIVFRMKKGLTVEEALTLERVRRSGPVEVGGKTYASIKSAGEAHGLKYGTVRRRLALGWTLERAVTLPV